MRWKRPNAETADRKKKERGQAARTGSGVALSVGARPAVALRGRVGAGFGGGALLLANGAGGLASTSTGDATMPRNEK